MEVDHFESYRIAVFESPKAMNTFSAITRSLATYGDQTKCNAKMQIAGSARHARSFTDSLQHKSYHVNLLYTACGQLRMHGPFYASSVHIVPEQFPCWYKHISGVK